MKVCAIVIIFSDVTISNLIVNCCKLLIWMIVVANAVLSHFGVQIAWVL